MNLLDGKFTKKNLQVGALSGQKISISISKMDAATIGIKDVKVSSFDSAGKAMKSIQGVQAINFVSTQRSTLGVLFRTDLSIQSRTLLIQQQRDYTGS